MRRLSRSLELQKMMELLIEGKVGTILLIVHNKEEKIAISSQND